MAADAVAWPFVTGGEITERYDWLSAGLAPRYGLEQVMAARLAPRMVLGFDGLESASTRRWMEQLLASNHGGHWWVPLAMDETIMSTGQPAGGGLLLVDTAHRRFVPGGAVMLVTPGAPRQHEVATVAEVRANRLVLDAPLAQAWPAGTQVSPAVACTLEAAPVVTRFTSDAAPVSLEFRAVAHQEIPADLGDTLYRELPVFEAPVRWVSDPTWSPRRALDVWEAPGTLALQRDPLAMVLPDVVVDVALEGLAAVSEFRRLLSGLAGRRHPIWVGSYAHDVRVTGRPGPAQLDIEWLGLSRTVLRPNRCDIRIDRHNGVPLYRRITAVEAMDTEIERLLLDTALPAGLGVGDIAMVSFMALSRQAADTALLRQVAPDLVLTQMTFAGCQHGL